MYHWVGANIKGHFSLSYININSTLDMASYLENARGIIHGTWPKSTFFRAPLYSYILALILIIKDSILAVVIIQGLFSCFTLILTYLICCRLFDRLSAYISVLILILYGGYFFWIAVPHSTVFETFFTTLSLYTVIKLKKSPDWYNGLLTGLAGGFLCLIRPNFLAVIPVAIIVMFCEQYFGKHRKKAKIYVSYIISLSAFILVLLPVIIWNNINSDRLMLTPCTNGRDGYKNSNSYDSEVFGYIYVKKKIMPITSFSFWKHQGKKTLAYGKSIEYPQNENYYIFKEYSVVLSFLIINFGFIVALFFASLFYNVRRIRSLWPVYWFVLGYALTVIIFHIIGRYRIPVVPAMAIVGGGWLKSILWTWWQKGLTNIPERLKKRIAISMLIYIAVFIFSEPWQEIDVPLYWDNLAHRYFYEEDLIGYTDCLSRKHNRFKDQGDLLNFIAAKSLSGDVKTAEVLLNKLINKYPAHQYLRITLQENNIIAGIGRGHINNEKWEEYRQAGQYGHIAQFYNSLEELKAEKRKIKQMRK